MMMAVMEVGPVRVGVHDRLVPVPVRVPGRGRQPWMLVIVVTVVVPVRMLVLDGVVGVHMRVAFDSEKTDADGEERAGRKVRGCERLTQSEHREKHAEEGRACERNLGARGAEPLRGGNVEHDARPVRPHADEQRGDHG